RRGRSYGRGAPTETPQGRNLPSLLGGTKDLSGGGSDGGLSRVTSFERERCQPIHRRGQERPTRPVGSDARRRGRGGGARPHARDAGARIWGDQNPRRAGCRAGCDRVPPAAGAQPLASGSV